MNFGNWIAENPDELDYGEENIGGSSGVRWLKANAVGPWFEGANNWSSQTLRGIIIQRSNPRAFFALDPQHPGYRNEAPYRFPTDFKPLCTWEGGSHPVVIRQDLNADHKKRLAQLGCGDCNTCQARWPYDDPQTGEKIRSYCSQSMKLLMLPVEADENGELTPMVLRVNAWLSRRAFDEWIDKEVKPQKLPLHAGIVELGWQASKNSRGVNVNVMTVRFVQPTPIEMKEAIESTREGFDLLEPRQVRPALPVAPPAAQLPAAQQSVPGTPAQQAMHAGFPAAPNGLGLEDVPF